MTSAVVRVLIALSLLCLLAGCESGNIFERGPDWQSDADLHKTAVEKQRRFIEDRDHEALNWLLKHRVKPGMSRGDVDEILGEDGERIYDDGSFKNRNSVYRQTDKAYSWGPAANGSTVVLIFRDNQLFNFRPQDVGLE
ncbi:MAG: hypothetical protein O3A00_21740 [Planctomycetota bacterium]|nr:hypothetical protein [Planctomycetota bacterium]